jgi:hypothetical protein
MITIAIDPDVTKSGVAILNPADKSLKLRSLTFPELVDYFAELRSTDCNVYVEAGWKINANWHITRYDSKASACAKGNSAGRNHEVGRKMVELCQHWGIPVREVKPLKKHWQGPDNKITHQELQRILSAYGIDLPKRTNQEERDATLIALYQVVI